MAREFAGTGRPGRARRADAKRPGRLRPRPIAWLRDHPHIADGLLAAALAVLGIVGLLVVRSAAAASRSAREADLWAVLLILAQTMPIIWRRRHSVQVLAAATAATIAYQIVGYADTPATLATLIAAYSVGAHVTRRRALWSGVALLVTLTVVNAIGVSVHRPNVSFWDTLGNWVVFATAFILGDNMRRRRERIADLEERAAALERERGMEAERAVAHERARIARELHDVVAHALSLMVVQSGAARRVLTSQPAMASEALESVEATGREALVEMRRLLGVLRADGDEAQLAPQPSLARLDELIAASADLPISLTIEGEPVPVSATIELSAFRIVQEALTNVRKHAGPASAQVVLRYDAEAIELSVCDDGRGASTALLDGASTGHGLLGMRERVALCGGQLRVGPRPGGGWSVLAHLPYGSGS